MEPKDEREGGMNGLPNANHVDRAAKCRPSGDEVRRTVME